MPKTETPGFDEIAANPARAADLAPEQRQQLILECAVVLAKRAAVLAALAAAPIEEASADHDRLIDAAAAAQMLGIARDTLRKKQVPFRVKAVGRATRYSLAGIERHMRTRQRR